MIESVDEEDWVVVKKQRIIILVPPPSPVKKSYDHDKNPTKIKSIKGAGRTSVISKSRKLSTGTSSNLPTKHLDNEVQKDEKLEKLDSDNFEHDAQDDVGRINCRRLETSKGRKLSEGPRHKPAATTAQRKMHSSGETGKHALNHAETHEDSGRLKHGRTDTSKSNTKLSERINDMPNTAFSESKHEFEKTTRNYDKIAAGDGASGLQCEKPAANHVPPVRIGIKHNERSQVLPQSSWQHAPQAFSTDRVLVPCRKRKRMSSPERFNEIARLPVGWSNIAIQKMRVVNLQRRLQMMGGLQNWLSSQRLAQFIKIFEREKLGMYQLVNLTMSKLKDMGADPVGPRRKLLNAIDSLCQPCFESIAIRNYKS